MRFHLLFIPVAYLSLLPAGLPAGEIGSSLDFRRIIEEAKSKVFPALIFVAPVVEDFGGGKRETREQGGSGVVISSDGFAVTNWHVVEKAIAIRVLLFDGRVTTAEKIGEDQETDVALLKLRPPPSPAPAAGPGAKDAGLPYASFGDSSVLTEGQFVMAMGAPWGLSRSVSLGRRLHQPRQLRRAADRHRRTGGGHQHPGLLHGR